MPRLSAYSIIVLLQSLLETQLFACAEWVGRRDSTVFRPRDFLGSRRGTMDVAVLFLRKAPGVDVTSDPVWSRLKDLQQLRDIIVHRSGTRGEAEEHQKTFDRLIQQYAPRLSVAEGADWLHGEIWVSLILCRDFAKDLGAFFARTLKVIGVPEDAIPREYRSAGA